MRNWTFIPAREHTDSITGLKHQLPAAVVENGIGFVATVNFGGPHHDNAKIGSLIAAAPRMRDALRKIDEACAVIPEGIEGYLRPLSDALVEVRSLLQETKDFT